MVKSFPRTLRRAAADNALIELLRDSPWERAMRECQAVEQTPSIPAVDRDARGDTSERR